MERSLSGDLEGESGISVEVNLGMIYRESGESMVRVWEQCCWRSDLVLLPKPI